MKSTVLRAGAAALATTAVLVLASCGGTDDEQPTAAATATAEAEEQEAEESATVEVPDVTVLILETAQGNLARNGLEVEVVDESGAPVTVDDATAYTVTAQEPAEGTVDRGSVVTLTVAPRG